MLTFCQERGPLFQQLLWLEGGKKGDGHIPVPRKADRQRNFPKPCQPQPHNTPFPPLLLGEQLHPFCRTEPQILPTAGKRQGNLLSLGDRQSGQHLHVHQAPAGQQAAGILPAVRELPAKAEPLPLPRIQLFFRAGKPGRVTFGLCLPPHACGMGIGGKGSLLLSVAAVAYRVGGCFLKIFQLRTVLGQHRQKRPLSVTAFKQQVRTVARHKMMPYHLASCILSPVEIRITGKRKSRVCEKQRADAAVFHKQLVEQGVLLQGIDRLHLERGGLRRPCGLILY